MLEGKAVIEDTDMPLKMQAQALTSASRALDLYEVFDCIPIAAYIKKVYQNHFKPIMNNQSILFFFFFFHGTFLD